MKILTISESQFRLLTRDIKDVDENSHIMLSKPDTSNPVKSFREISINSRKFYKPILELSNSSFENAIILSRVNASNLGEAGSADSLQYLELHRESVCFSPHFASSASLASLNTYTKVELSMIDDCLKNYFKTTRYVCEGDLISIDTEKYVPDILVQGTYPRKLYFKATSLKGLPYDVDGVTCGYYIDIDHTTVHQVSSVSSRVPRCDVYHYLHSESLECSVVPDGLNDYATQIEDMLLPFLNLKTKLAPIFLITGKSGTGKATLLSSVAAKHGLRYFDENCISIQSSNAVQTEKAISNILSKISNLSPCVLHFRNIEGLCRDESSNNDDRTVDYFAKQIKSNVSNFPVFVFCSSSSCDDISPALRRIFLQTLHINPPNFDSACSLLKWLLKRMQIHHNEAHVEGIVRATPNFVYADFVRLICRALQIRCQESDCGESCELQKSHFDQALQEITVAYADSLGTPEIPNVTWDDVGGLSELKRELLSSLHSSTSMSKLRRSGILLYGPPGTGKTLLAKAIATECKYNFLSVKGPELLNMYVGQSEKNVREVFARARECAPCIIFFDEFDSLAPKRGQSGGSGSVMDRVVSQLLAEMDGIQLRSQVFILAATNRYDLIDSALLRPGRLDKMLYVGGCNDFHSKLNVLKALTRKFKVSPDVNFESLVERIPESQTVTGADLYGVCSQAWLNAARRTIKTSQETESECDKTVYVSQNDFVAAFSYFRNIPEQQRLVKK